MAAKADLDINVAPKLASGGTAPKDPPCMVRSTPTLECLDENATYGDFRDDLMRDGFCVVKGAISPEKAVGYSEDIHEWLESFGLGYKRDDPSTIKEENLPIISPKGMVQAYGAPHESFTWNVRSEPGVVGAFEKLYGTEDLIVSFDAVNVSLANRKDIAANGAWAHQDQDPERPGFRCVQGFVNLLPNGPEDGGLMVLKGGHKVSQEYHDTFRHEDRGFRWTNEMYIFKETGLDWLKERGFVWVKVCCEPGDLVLWDSRTPHYNQSPTSNTCRFVVYTCYLPVSTATKEELIAKRQMFYNTKGHSHWPQGLQPFIEEYVAPMRDGKPDPLNKWAPRQAPQLSERAFKLTGIPYIEATA